MTFNKVGQFRAADVTITDAGGYYTATEVEAALQEISTSSTLISHANLSDMPSSSNDDHDGRYYTETELSASGGSDLIGDHNGHTVKDTFEHIINRGKTSVITVTLTGGLGISWISGELYDKDSKTFISTDSGSGNLTNNVINYLKWVSGTTLTISTSSSADDEILIAIFSVYDGNINGHRETSLMNVSLANTRRGMRALFPTRIISGMSVSEDTDVTNPLDVQMDAGVLWKDGIEKSTPIEIKSRNTAMVRHFHTASAWDSDTDAEIDTANYDNGTQKTAIPNNKWVKSMFIFMNGKIGWVYPNAYYNTKAQALLGALPTIPPGLELVPKLTAIVYQEGDASFTQTTWQDIRPGISEESFAGVSDHGALAGLSDDDHTQYALLAGRSGGQILIGGLDASDDLTLQSTSDATRGSILIPDDLLVNSGTLFVDVSQNSVGILTSSIATSDTFTCHATRNQFWQDDSIFSVSDASGQGDNTDHFFFNIADDEWYVNIANFFFSGILNVENIANTGAINLKPSGDNDDYIQFSTTSNVPTISVVGGSALNISSDSFINLIPNDAGSSNYIQLVTAGNQPAISSTSGLLTLFSNVNITGDLTVTGNDITFANIIGKNEVNFIGSSSHTYLDIVAPSTSYDAALRLYNSATAEWAVGFDNSHSDDFCINTGGTINYSSAALRIVSSTKQSIFGGDVQAPNGLTAAKNFILSKINSTLYPNEISTADTTPNAGSGEIIKLTNNGTWTITNFDNQPGTCNFTVIYTGGGTLTIQHNADIRCPGGANITLNQNDTACFTFIDRDKNYCTSVSKNA